MRVLSASEAIDPAIGRTRAVLFQPFKKGRSWKLAATAYLAVMGNIFLPTHLTILGMPRQPGATGAGLLIFSLIFGLVVTLVMLAIFYIGARLQFARFDIVVNKAQMVAPLWNKYGFCTWRWIGFKLALSAVFLIVCGVPFIRGFRFLMTHLPVPGQPPPPEFMHAFFMAYAGIMLAIFTLMLVASLFNDFVLPSIALEGVSVSEGLRRFIELIRREPGQIISYIFFKAILGIAAAVAMEIAILIVEFVAMIPLGIIGVLGYLALHSMGPIGQVLLVAGGVVLLLIFVAFLFYSTILFCGCFVVFFQAYAVYFLGGRYPMLGDLLEPAPSSLTFASPVPPPDLPPAPRLLYRRKKIMRQQRCSPFAPEARLRATCDSLAQRSTSRQASQAEL